MFLDKHNFASVAPAKSSGHRLNLAQLRLMPWGVLSTSGHAVLVSTYPQMDPADLPRIEGVDPAAPLPPEGLGIASADAAALAKAIPKSKNPAIAGVQVDAARGVAGVTDFGAATTRQLGQEAPGTWPSTTEWDKAMQEALAGRRVVAAPVDLDNLLEVLTALRKACRKDDPVVTLRLWRNDNDATLTFAVDDGSAGALLMPLREDVAPAPDVISSIFGLKGQEGQEVPHVQ